MAKFSREYKMISADGSAKLRIYAKEGKRGINVGVTIKDPGVKARTGCQDTFEKVDDANTRFTELMKQADETGWLPRGEATVSNGRRSAFTAIPVSPGAVPQPEPTEVQDGDIVDKDGFIADPVEEPAPTVPVAVGESEAESNVVTHSGRGRRK